MELSLSVLFVSCPHNWNYLGLQRCLEIQPQDGAERSPVLNGRQRSGNLSQKTGGGSRKTIRVETYLIYQYNMKKGTFSSAAVSMAMAVVTAAAAGVMMCACGGPKSVAKAEGEVEVSVPCGDYHTDKEFFRGSGSGQSKDLNTAREKARMAANTELAGSISVVIKGTAERYVNDAGQSPADYGETFETMTRQVINQELSNLSVACNKTMQTRDKMFKVYMAMEVKKDEVFATLERAAANTKKLETIYDREKFRKVYNEEMESMAKDRQAGK